MADNNPIIDLLSKLQHESAKSTFLKSKLRNCHHSKVNLLNDMLDKILLELQYCQKELRNLKTISTAQNAEIEEQGNLQLEGIKVQLKNSLMENEALSLNLEQLEQDSGLLVNEFQSFLKSEELIQHMGDFGEFLTPDFFNPQNRYITRLEHQIRNLEQQLQIANQDLAAEKKISKETQIALKDKEKELSYVKGFSQAEANIFEQKIRILEEEKKNVADSLEKVIAEFKKLSNDGIVDGNDKKCHNVT